MARGARPSQGAFLVSGSGAGGSSKIGVPFISGAAVVE